MAVALKDYATGTVLTAPSPATTGTSLTLQSGEGARFPTAPFYVTAHPDGTFPTLDNAEKLLVSAVATDTFTIARHQGSTTAKSIATSWRISNAIFTNDIIDSPATTVDSEVVLFSGTDGRTIKRASGTGYAKLASGVLSAQAVPIPVADGGTNATSASAARTSLGLVINTDVQAHDADLDTIAGLTATTDNFIVSVASAWASRTPAQVRTTLGLVIGTNVQAWDNDLDAIAGLSTTGLINRTGAGTATTVTAPSGAVVGDTDTQTLTNKVLSDEFIGDVFDSQSATKQNITLGTSTDYVALDMLEVGATKTMEVPATSTLEVVSYTSRSDPTGTALVPVGVIEMFAGVNSPTGWLICDGSAVSRTTYSNLFNVIGTAYGVGNGTTTFNIPDFRGRSPMGAGTGTATGAAAKTLGSQPTSSIGGEETHVMTTSELVAHSHQETVASSTGGATGITGTAGLNAGSSGVGQNTVSAGASAASNITHPISVVNFIIKV